VTGNEYKKLIGQYIVSAYGPRGLSVYDEVHLGTSIIGKQRRIDLFVLGPEGQALCVECKYQDTSGTADEKIPYALNDMRSQRIPGVIVYAGTGFSAGVLHLLQGSEYAAYCLPDASLRPTGRGNGPMSSGTWQLDHIIAQTFKLWDVILGKKKALELAPQLLPSSANLLEAKIAEALPMPVDNVEETVEPSSD
jgi:hypothetical protein